MCPETCRKIEHLIIKVQSPSRNVISFFGAVIGYSRHDCAAQLVRSLAGVQFIGLAAVMLPTFGAYQASQALAEMLNASASDKTIVPPARHLKDLLNSLEYRCVQMGFSDLVLGWQQMLCNSPITDKGVIETDQSTDGFAKLIDAFRQLSRIGDASHLVLKTEFCE